MLDCQCMVSACSFKLLHELCPACCNSLPGRCDFLHVCCCIGGRQELGHRDRRALHGDMFLKSVVKQLCGLTEHNLLIRLRDHLQGTTLSALHSDGRGSLWPASDVTCSSQRTWHGSASSAASGMDGAWQLRSVQQHPPVFWCSPALWGRARHKVSAYAPALVAVPCSHQKNAPAEPCHAICLHTQPSLHPSLRRPHAPTVTAMSNSPHPTSVSS